MRTLTLPQRRRLSAQKKGDGALFRWRDVTLFVLFAAGMWMTLFQRSIPPWMLQQVESQLDNKPDNTHEAGHYTSIEDAVINQRLSCPNPFLPGTPDRTHTFDRAKQEELVFKTLPDSTLVVIGANVGATSTDGSWETLKHYPTVKSIFVEPVPTLFKQLVNNVEAAGINNTVLINAAIGETQGTTKMFCWHLDKIKTLKLPDWFSQVCSFDRKRLYTNPKDTALMLNRRFPRGFNPESFADQNIIEVPVAVERLQELIKANTRSFNEVSVVQIDTEGYDYHVVKQLPLDDPAFRPCLIVWEDMLLSQEANQELIRMVGGYGYGFAVEFQNTVMYRMS